MTVMICVGAK